MDKQIAIGESKLLKEPKQTFRFLIGEGAVKTKHLGNGSVSLSKLTEDVKTLLNAISPIEAQVANLASQLNGHSVVTCTEEEYNAMAYSGELDEDTLYFIEEDEEDEGDEEEEEEPTQE